MNLHKYPRTHHLEGSRRQPGDEDLNDVPLSTLGPGTLVVEEKLDGANCGLSFDEDGSLLLQSRGHYLDGGAREQQFRLFKTWANTHQAALRDRLKDRYLMFGEWLYAKHTVYYDRLPHYFMEFDIYDRQEEVFLSTPRRRELLAGLPVVSVPVLYSGPVPSLGELESLVVGSLYKSQDWQDSLREQAVAHGQDPDRVWRETDPDERAEGLYCKLEHDGRVVGRYKFVRTGFLTSVLDSGSHWMSRPILPNRLAEGVDLFRC